MAKAAPKKTASRKGVAASSAKKPATKKSAPKKSAAKEDKPKIKYSDKSAGQPQLVPIFNEIAKLLENFHKAPLQKNGGKGGQVSLSSTKPVEIAGKKLDELYLAGALVQKGYVGFYYFPVYVEPALRAELAPELLKCLKGKTCFHIKKDDPLIYAQIKDALKKGYDLYKKRGWI